MLVHKIMRYVFEEANAQTEKLIDYVIEKCKLLSNDTKFGCISRQKVSKFVHINCRLSLQNIKWALSIVWSFSISLEGGNKGGNHILIFIYNLCLELHYSMLICLIFQCLSHIWGWTCSICWKSNECIMLGLGKENHSIYIGWSL